MCHLKDKGYFTGKKKDAEAQKVLLDAATEQAGDMNDSDIL